MTDIRNVKLPIDSQGRPIATHVVSPSLAVNQYTVTTGTEQDHTLDVETSVVIVTVADYPVKMKAGTTATSSDYDHYLITGQHTFLVGEGIDSISFIADGGNALVTVVERGDV